MRDSVRSSRETGGETCGMWSREQTGGETCGMRNGVRSGR